MKQLIFCVILLMTCVISVSSEAVVGGKSFSAWVDGGSHLKKKMDNDQFKMKGVDSEGVDEGYGKKYNMGGKELNVKALDGGKVKVQGAMDAGKIQIQGRMDSQEETEGYKPVDVLKLDDREATEDYEPIDPFELDDDKLHMTH